MADTILDQHHPTSDSGETTFDRFFRAHPELRLRALGVRENLPALDLAPFGHSVDFLDARTSPEWVEKYYSANRIAFPPRTDAPDTALPRWVLCDLYLMPTVIGLLTCPAGRLDPAGRTGGIGDDEEDVAAAYVAIPSLLPGVVIGVSLLSRRHGIGAGAMIKALTLKMLRTRTQRGITQWKNASLRDHTRMGILRVEGRAVGHGLEAESLVYVVDVSDEAQWMRAMEGRLLPRDGTLPEGAEWIPLSDGARLIDIMRRAENGETIEILPPGLSRERDRILIRATPR